ncbi:hypothetical protein [Candidatus Parabeggiatoa sp. HSG14]|uniref:P-type ATPase n=1 Tax=Candidatus Parabeggiatoa sp. HSG14 TaxID=3055593 RepID=UPI0025A6C78C|nr:hypothetical protein [Thiotrichales bacterium HSG14]
MLIEVGFVIGAYFGIRLSERHKTANKLLAVQKRLKPQDSKLKEIASKGLENPQTQEIEFVKKNKKADHYLKVSIAHLGIAAIRQFIYPPVAPLYLGFFIYNNFPLYRRAEKSLVEEKRIGRDGVTTLASVVALATGQYLAMGVGCFFYFLGDKIVILSQRRSKELLTNTFKQLPRMVWCLRDSVEVETPLEEVHINDIVVVTIGLVVPIDGIIVDGAAMIDQHALTGESQPAEKNIGGKGAFPFFG